MIQGVGTDIILIERLRKAADKAAFLSRVFTEKELLLYENRGHDPAVLAGCFAGKEAVAKALGTGFRGFWPSSIEILRGEKGQPIAILHGPAKAQAETQGIKTLHISLSNTSEHAMAFVVAEG